MCGYAENRILKRVGKKNNFMKKTIFLLLLITSIKNAAISQISVLAFPMDPQTGSYNYFGVRVSLQEAKSQDITISGYITDPGGSVTNKSFQLTIYAGNLTAETETNFFQTDPTAIAEAHLGSISTTYGGAQVTYEVNGCILKFSTTSDYNLVLQQLETDYELFNDNYENQYPGLTDEQLDDLDEQNGFDEFTPLKEFESLFGGFCSKRSEIEAVENTWLANNMTGIDPDDIDLTFDDAENTIFNNNYSFKIGNDTYQLTETGTYINGILWGGNNSTSHLHIPTWNDNKDQLSAGPYAEEISSVSTNYNFAMRNTTECKSNKKSSTRSDYSSNGRMKFKIAINSIAIRSSVKSKAVNFKKKNNGNWKRSRVNMAVGCGGTVYEGDCSSSFQFNDRFPLNGFKKRKQAKCTYRSGAAIPGNETIWKTYTNMIAGTVDAPSINVSATLILTF